MQASSATGAAQDPPRQRGEQTPGAAGGIDQSGAALAAFERLQASAAIHRQSISLPQALRRTLRWVPGSSWFDRSVHPRQPSLMALTAADDLTGRYT